MLLEDIRNPSDAIRVAERLQARLSAPFTVHGYEIVVTASVGIALSTAACAHAEDLLRDANIAMYRAKRTGKARCEVSIPPCTPARSGVWNWKQNFARPGTGRIPNPLPADHFPEDWQDHGLRGLDPMATRRAPARARRVHCGGRRDRPDHSHEPLLLREACEQLRWWHAQFPADPPLTMSVNITSKEFAFPRLWRKESERLWGRPGSIPNICSWRSLKPSPWAIRQNGLHLCFCQTNAQNPRKKHRVRTHFAGSPMAMVSVDLQL